MKYLDLFSGAGGMSLGFKSVGFELVLTIEKSPMAGETFYHNFIEQIDSELQWKSYLNKSKECQIDSGLYVGPTSDILDSEELFKKLKEKSQDLDLIVGGPPCQGFSMAGKRDKNDIRNELPWEFLEYVSRLEPKFVLIENVTGIRNKFNNEELTPLEQIKKVLEEKLSSKYKVQALELNANDYGVPQNRKRVFLLGVRKDIAIKLNCKFTKDIWNSSKEPIDLSPKESKSEKLTVNDAFSNEKYISSLEETFGSFIKHSNSGVNLNHIERKHSDKVVERFKLYQLLKEININRGILKLASSYTENKVEIKRILSDIEYPIMDMNNNIYAKSVDEFILKIIPLATKKQSQKPLDLNKPSPTVMSMPDDVIHPTIPRAVTVREQARFQSFPDRFEFKSKETTGGKMRKIEVPQFTQVGNAVPPLLARAIAMLIKDLINKLN